MEKKQPQLPNMDEKTMASFLNWVKASKPWHPKRPNLPTSAPQPMNILWVTKEGECVKLDPRTEQEGRTGELIGSLFCYDPVFELLSGKEVRC